MKKLQALVGVAVTLGLAAVARDAPPSPRTNRGSGRTIGPNPKN